MRGILVLAGSGEFTGAMEATDRHILSSTGAKNVAIVPTAAGLEPQWRKWIGDGVRHFKNLGALPFGVAVLNRKDAQNPEFVRDLEKADFIYFSGGHPGHLFRSLNKTPFWEKVIEKFKSGSILAGSSAGAMIMGKYVFSNAQESRREDPVWEKSFGLIDYSIIPHYDFITSKLPEVFEKIESDSTPLKIRKSLMGINEDTALVIDSNNQAEVMGPPKGGGGVYILGESKTNFKIGSRFEIKINS